MALVTVDLHGQILAPDGLTPAVGEVQFRSLTELRDTVDNIVYAPQLWTATLDLAGEFTITLPTTDNPDITPLNWTYQVWVATDVWTEQFYMPLPGPGPVVEFADLLPLVTTTPCTPDGTLCAPVSVIGAIAALELQVDELAGQVAELADDVAALDAEVDALGATVTGLQTDVAALQTQVGTIQIDLDNLEIFAQATQNELDATQADVTTLQGQVATLQGQITTLQGQVTANTASIATNTTNITTLQGQVTTLQGQMATAQTNITTLQGQMATANTNITNLQTAVTTLQGNVVYLDPTTAGTYVGNTFTPPPNPAAAQPWLKSAVIPYSPGDTNFDIIRLRAQDEFGNTVNTGTANGNGEGRDRPSSRSRVGRRSYESAEAVGGSTGQYVQWSSDATVPADREPFLGGWGSASAKPGWVEATRVLSALAGNSIGGTVNAALAPYNTLSAFIFRGLKTTAGAPAAGTWAVNDVILDSLGVVYRCTVAGTPGTWVGNVNGTPIAVAFTAPAGNAATISDGTGSGAPYALTTTLKTADNRVYFDGSVANNGGVPIVGGTVLFTVTAAHAPTAWVQCNERTSTLLSSRVTVRPDGTVRLDQALAAGATISLDGFNYRKS